MFDIKDYNDFVNGLTSKDFHSRILQAGPTSNALAELVGYGQVLDVAKKALFYGKFNEEYMEEVQDKELCHTGWTDFIVRKEAENPGIDMKLFLHGFMGVASELPEIAIGLTYNGFEEGEDIKFSRSNFIEECGDILFYLTMMLNSVNSTLQEAMDINTDKLKVRYPEGKFTPHRANNRDLEAEGEVINGVDPSN